MEPGPPSLSLRRRAGLAVGCLPAVSLGRAVPLRSRAEQPQAKETPDMARTIDLAKLKTFGGCGKAMYPFEGGKEAELFAHKGKGCLTHMWFGGNWKDYGRQRIRVYVDGEKTASIDMELHLGHGAGFQDPNAPWVTRHMGITGSPSGVYNTFKIPFGRSVRVTSQLHGGDKKNKRFWFIIRGTENLPVEIAGVRLPARARLRLHRLENYTAEEMKEFDLCDIKSAGALYQVTMQAKSTKWQYLESCVRAYIDGAASPMVMSSGLEDYFLGTYYFNRGPYTGDVAGLTHMDKKDFSFSAYRFHDEDPVFFQKRLRLTLRNGEQTEREKWHCPPTTYTTYVWAYEW